MCNQENQLLLNAIRNKFSSPNDIASFSPAKFNIPLLKTASASSTQSDIFTPPTLKLTNGSHIKQPISNRDPFELCCLEKNSTHTANGFVLPQLITAINKNAEAEDSVQNDKSDQLHPSKTSENNSILNESSPINTINERLDQLSVDEESPKKNRIDLTTALSHSTLLGLPKPVKVIQPEFDIPFIDCDLREESVGFPFVPEHCQPDISHLKLEHCLVKPSSFARITCLQFKLVRPLPPIDHSFKAKHRIQRFRFDTKSPDDLIIANLKKFQR